MQLFSSGFSFLIFTIEQEIIMWKQVFCTELPCVHAKAPFFVSSTDPLPSGRTLICVSRYSRSANEEDLVQLW